MITLDDIQKKDTYCWVSPKDGWFYDIKILSVIEYEKTKKITFMPVIVKKAGYVSTQRESLGTPKSVYLEKQPNKYRSTKSFLDEIDTDLQPLLLRYLLNAAEKRNSSVNFDVALLMMDDLREILNNNPDKYIKYMDKKYDAKQVRNLRPHIMI